MQSTQSDSVVDEGSALNSRRGARGTVEKESSRVNLLSKTSSFGRLTDSTDSAVEALAASFKNLYVSNRDQRHSFQLAFRIFEETSEQQLFSFTTNEIKVISKPSRNKTVSKSPDLSILSGDHIALFNRVRSQTVSTRYLTVSSDGSRLTSRHSPWDIFVVWRLDDDEAPKQAVPSELNQDKPESPLARQVSRARSSSAGAIMPLPSASFASSSLWGNALGNESELSSLDPCGPHIRRGRSNSLGMYPSSMPLGRWPNNPFLRRSPQDLPEGAAHRNAGAGTVIRYGDTVVLENFMTGLRTVPLVVRRVDGKSLAILKAPAEGKSLASSLATTVSPEPHYLPKDIISQLHKIAFQIKSQPGHYISLEDEAIVIFKTARTAAHTTAAPMPSQQGDSGIRRDTPTVPPSSAGSVYPTRAGLRGSRSAAHSTDPFSPQERQLEESNLDSEDVSDMSVWSIISVDVVESTFVPAPQSARSTTPFGHSDSDQQLNTADNDGVSTPLLDMAPLPIVELVSNQDPFTLILSGVHIGAATIWVFAGTLAASDVTVITPSHIQARFEFCRVIVMDERSRIGQPAPNPPSTHQPCPASMSVPKAFFGPSESNQAVQTDEKEVPILLVRSDGAIYRTRFYVTLSIL
eukprot:jgi/Hompol1/2399/HPOL_005984-RA